MRSRAADLASLQHQRGKRVAGVVEITRSRWYDQPVLDEPYTATPLSGVRRMTACLWGRGYAVDPKRVRRRLRPLG